jgi:hypothetical protein
MASTNPVANLFKIPELKEKILFTLLVLFIYRIGAHISAPGIDVSALQAQFAQFGGTLFGVYDMFVGGALSRATVLSLGIMPYISASIMFQLLAAVVPSIEKMQKEGEDGRKKLTQWTRYATVGLALAQGYGYAVFIQNIPNAVLAPGMLTFLVPTALVLTTGAVFVMWLGEQITERGIGNGMSLLIFFSIIESFPQAVARTWEQLTTGVIGIFPILVLLLVMRSGHDHGCAQDTGADPAQGDGPRSGSRRSEELHPTAHQLGRRHADYFCTVHHHPAGHVRCIFQWRFPDRYRQLVPAGEHAVQPGVWRAHSVLHVLLHLDHLQPGRSGGESQEAGRFRARREAGCPHRRLH